MFFVRTAMAQDLEIVREILIETWHHTYDKIYGAARVTEITNSWHTLETLASYRERQHSEFLVADNGHVIGGMAFASQTDKIITLHQLYVHPKYQGGKTGLHLMIEIENSFLDAEMIRLEVEAQNEHAVDFYKKYGFKQVGEIDSVEKSGDAFSILVMEKPVVYAED